MKFLTMSSQRKTFVVATTFVVALMSTGTSFAGDCKQVKFKFTNKLILSGTNAGVDIKVKKIAAVGNDGSWNENIGNKKIGHNKSHTTNKRKLNKLDSGQTGQFTVHFDHRKIGPGWQSATRGPFSKKCDDGKTLSFTIQ